MSEEENVELAVSEQPDVEQQESNEEQKMVPLAALEAERRKRQDETTRRAEAEAKANFYEKYVNDAKNEKEAEEDDPNALLDKGYYQHDKQMTRREILEEVYKDMNPEAVNKINKYLKPIIEKKPWLADTLQNARNRYAQAYEIVQDYMHLVEPTQGRKSGSNDAARIVQNSQKPGSPTELGKSAQLGGKEFLKSIQGTPEFRDYRKKVLRGGA